VLKHDRLQREKEGRKGQRSSIFDGSSEGGVRRRSFVSGNASDKGMAMAMRKNEFVVRTLTKVTRKRKMKMRKRDQKLL